MEVSAAAPCPTPGEQRSGDGTEWSTRSLEGERSLTVDALFIRLIQYMRFHLSRTTRSRGSSAGGATPLFRGIKLSQRHEYLQNCGNPGLGTTRNLCHMHDSCISRLFRNVSVRLLCMKRKENRSDIAATGGGHTLDLPVVTPKTYLLS